MDDPEEEAKRLEAILSRSTEPALAFGNDSDDMRSPGKAIDPRAMVGDMSSDAIAYAVDRMEIIRDLLTKLLEKSPEEGRSYQSVRDERSTLMGNYRSQLDVIARYIGGVYVDRALVGQEGGTQPLTPVALADQKRAMEALANYAFAADAFEPDAELLTHLQLQRRGWDFESTGEDPKLFDEYLGIQNSALNHILHKNTITRILNSELYGNEYPISLVLDDLTGSIFKTGDNWDADPNNLRQGLQRSYVDRLIKIAGLETASAYPQTAQALAHSQLSIIRSQNIANSAHHDHLYWIIDKALSTEK
ncbi:MAG: zinc-dependent metalloprotease [Verrucomicrobiota bacterium]